MVKTKVKKKNPAEAVNSSEKTNILSNNVNNSSSSNSILLGLICLLLLIVVVLQIVDLSQKSEDLNLDEINEKVTRLDTFFKNNIPEYQETPQELDPTDFPKVDKPNIENRPILGSADAKIILVEYSDFECPFCGRFFQTTYPTLKKYVDSGDAALVFKDFPLSFHQLAEPSAIASKCVFKDLGDEKFFEYHDVLFTKQQELSVENFKTWALELGMDEAKYDSCIQDSTIKQMVQEDFAEGQQLGVSGTPSVVLNDKLIVGACPAQTFEQAIELELAGTPFFVQECQVISQ